MRYDILLTLLFALGIVLGLLTGCDGRALPPPCCTDVDGILVCRDTTCPELQVGKECRSLSVELPRICQVLTTDYCTDVILEHVTNYLTAFQTVYCF